MNEVLQALSQIMKWVGTPLFSVGDASFSFLGIIGLMAILFGSWWASSRLEDGIRRLMLSSKQSLRIDDSTIYALMRLVRYAVWFGGTLIGLSWLGISFESLALIGGAIGVGIGFGLQNIFSNFISGIILIFEKTLKVGDFVDLQTGVTGSVSEIALRYTRVTTRDNVDVIVPNSEFVNGRVVNWSFNEKNRRIHVPFGVAYGCDKDMVREAVIDAAKQVEGTVLNDPHRPIEVWLVAFGDSSLNFELVVWVEYFLMTRPGKAQAQYLWAIETKLRERSIEIPFPQRDLHLRSGELKVKLERSTRASNPGNLAQE